MHLDAHLWIRPGGRISAFFFRGGRIIERSPPFVVVTGDVRPPLLAAFPMGPMLASVFYMVSYFGRY